MVEAVAAAAGLMNRYPDPDATLLRRRLAERYETDPSRVAVGNGSCEILLAAAEALCEPGDEILYAWPAFSMYPYLPALTGAREVRVPLAEGDIHDLDAMAAEVTAATQLLIVCNPNNPTATHIPAAEIAAFCERIPPHVTVILDEAYVEFQTHDDPDATLDLLADFPNLVVLRTFSKCYGLAGLRVGYAIGSPKFRAAVDAVRQPVQRQRPRPGGGGGGDPPPGRRPAPGREHDRRPPHRRGGRCAELGLRTSDSHANFSWIDLGDADEAAVIAGLAEREIAVRPGKALGGPGHIRVSYGTAEENERFLRALSELLD